LDYAVFDCRGECTPLSARAWTLLAGLPLRHRHTNPRCAPCRRWGGRTRRSGAASGSPSTSSSAN
jgi:hypothetical protein